MEDTQVVWTDNVLNDLKQAFLKLKMAMKLFCSGKSSMKNRLWSVFPPIKSRYIPTVTLRTLWCTKRNLNSSKVFFKPKTYNLSGPMPCEISTSVGQSLRGLQSIEKNNTTKLSRLTQYLLNSDIASVDCLVQLLRCFDAFMNLAFLVAGGTLESLIKDDNGNRKSQIKITLLDYFDLYQL